MTPPRRLGSYELIERLAQGGMGEVWRARHAMLGREAAVKLIRTAAVAEGSGAEASTLQRRFEREVQATAKLSSPHTIDIFDFGSTDDGSFYYAMELLDGVDLRTLLDEQGPPPVARTLPLLVQICESLAEAHAEGLVHRDVKPANVVLTRSGLRYDFIKVLDFGLVTAAADRPGQDVTLTTQGAAPGSPAYMSPEAIRATERVDARADIYSFGCLAFHLLTGRLPFAGANPMQVLIAHIERPAPRLSDRCEQQLPAGLDELVGRCMAKQPDERPADLLEVARALQRLEPSPPWTQDDARRWWEQHHPFTAWRPAPEPYPSADEPAPRAEPAAAAEPAEPVTAQMREAREKAVDVLRSHYDRSHLNVHRFELRTRQALRARSPAELKPLLDDLPELEPDHEAARQLRELLDPEPEPRREVVAPARAEDPAVTAEFVETRGEAVRGGLPVPARPRRRMTIVSVFGENRREGGWNPAPRTQVVSVMGGTHLDFRGASLQPGRNDVDCFALMGGAEIVVPPDLYVEVEGFGFMGSFHRRGFVRSTAQRPQDDAVPWLRITGVAFMGEVSVQVKEEQDRGVAGLIEGVGEVVEDVVRTFWGRGRRKRGSRRGRR